MHTIKLTAADGRQVKVSGDVNEHFNEKLKEFFSDQFNETVEVEHVCIDSITCPECSAVTSYCKHEGMPRSCSSCKVRFRTPEMVKPIEGRVKHG